MTQKKELTQKRLKELLWYDPESGFLVWRAGRGGCKKGSRAGNINKVDGYRRIKIDGKSYCSGPLIWLWMEGYWPEHEVDHKDRMRNNDRWSNLRHVTHQCNNRNKEKRKSNTSGVTGVHWYKDREKWGAYIMINQKQIKLGYHTKITDAAKARWEAEVKYDFPNCNSVSSAYLYLKERNMIW